MSESPWFLLYIRGDYERDGEYFGRTDLLEIARSFLLWPQPCPGYNQVSVVTDSGIRTFLEVDGLNRYIADLNNEAI